MSLLVMGIGLTTLATLFPISILRTVRATQLTNAAILRYNVEALIDSYPHLVHDPDNDGGYYTATPNFARISEHFDEDSNGNNQFETAAPLSEDRNGNGRFDRGVYVVDPLGWWTQQGTGFEDQFGHYGIAAGGGPTAPPNPPVGLIPRFRGSNPGNTVITTQAGPIRFPANLTEAAQLASLPDSWTFVTEGTPTNVINASAGPNGGTVIGVDMTGADLTGLDLNADNVPVSRYRVTLFDATGRGSLVRLITRVNGNNLEWSEDFNDNGQLNSPPEPDFNVNGRADSFALPPGFEVERVRLEVQAPRYSWLLTVRKNTLGVANVSVAVFFNRSFREEDERIHLPPPSATPMFFSGWRSGLDGQPGVAGNDDDGVNGTDDNGELGWPGSDDELNRQLQIAWSGTAPDFKRGGFLFDVEGGLWYRIEGYSDPSVSPVTVAVERPIERTSTGPGGAIVFRNVIDVFPLAPREMDPRHRVR